MKRYIIIALIIIAALGIEGYEWHAISQMNTLKLPDKKLQANIQTLADENNKLLTDNKKLKEDIKANTDAVKALQDQTAKLATAFDKVQQSEIELLVDKLKDKNYTSTYNEDHTWYTAAEALGTIGKPAIPYLVKKIDTEDAYERSQVFYALLLASQADNVKEFAGSDYIKITDSFDANAQDEMKKEVQRWWDKYQDKF